MELVLESLKRLEEYAKSNHIPVIKENTRSLVVSLLQTSRPCAVLEIGTAIGYSALLMALHLPLDATITTIEIDDKRAALARTAIANAGLSAEIQVIVGDAAMVLPELAGPFDFVFIDAAKGQYPVYLEKLLGKLADGAYIVADNVLFRGMVHSSASIPRRFRTIVRRLQTYLAAVQEDPHFVTTLYEIDDGIAVTRFCKETTIL